MHTEKQMETAEDEVEKGAANANDAKNQTEIRYDVQGTRDTAASFLTSSEIR